MIDIEIRLAEQLAKARKLYVGKEAIVKEYQRLGRIESVMCDSEGFLLLCFYVYKAGTKEFLNGKPWTRQYRRLSELRFNI